MKTKIGILVLVLCTSFFTVQAQRQVVTTTRANSYDISDNLDLDAVSSIFGDSKDLEDFEYRLNDPDNRISNLDLNGDGYIDYLRVIENSSDRNSLIVIQAVLDKDIYQDVATIEVERVSNGNPRIQIVGDAYIYGSNYIIEPVFVRTPLIFLFLLGASPYRMELAILHGAPTQAGIVTYTDLILHLSIIARHVYEHINFGITRIIGLPMCTAYHYFSDENYNHISAEMTMLQDIPDQSIFLQK